VDLRPLICMRPHQPCGFERLKKLWSCELNFATVADKRDALFFSHMLPFYLSNLRHAQDAAEVAGRMLAACRHSADHPFLGSDQLEKIDVGQSIVGADVGNIRTIEIAGRPLFRDDR
jgi:hypothetical protein